VNDAIGLADETTVDSARRDPVSTNTCLSEDLRRFVASRRK
jgi:hypothetical protein